uniref:peptide deformylase n=1 Tax=Nonomuraea bangladeshensis TaxID=404385 RepID=UPI003F49B225
MKAAIIVQAGHLILGHHRRTFDLSADAGQAREVIDALFAALQRVREHHLFGKGIGLAAPQICIGRATAIASSRPTPTPSCWSTPRITDACAKPDEQYEGCLSFFDARGMVPRPLTLEVGQPIGPWR